MDILHTLYDALLKTIFSLVFLFFYMDAHNLFSGQFEGKVHTA